VAYREVSMEEIREVLRLWLAGRGIQPIAVQVGLDRKTVRRYAAAARACGVERGAASVTEEQWTAIAAALQPERESTHGETWRLCVEHQTRIEQQLATPLKLTRIQALLRRDGIELPYSTLHRFAVRTLGFGRRAPTIAVLDGEPGHELQVDTGWMTYLEPDGTGPRRRFRAWIFTPSFSRYLCLAISPSALLFNELRSYAGYPKRPRTSPVALRPDRRHRAWMLNHALAVTRALLAIFANRADLILENLALRQQLAVLRRKHPRPRLRASDQVF